MTAQSQLEAYLGEFRQRLKALIVARGAALLAFAALIITWTMISAANSPPSAIHATTALTMSMPPDDWGRVRKTSSR